MAFIINIGGRLCCWKAGAREPFLGRPLDGGLERGLSLLAEEEPELRSQPAFVTLSAGCGLQYKAFAISQDSIFTAGRRTPQAEQREALSEACRERQPQGLEGDWASCVMSAYETDAEFVLSCAYAPADVLEQVKACSWLHVLDVSPLSYGVWLALDRDREDFGQVAFWLPEELILANGLGLLCWARPEGYPQDDDSADYLAGSASAFFGTDPAATRRLSLPDLQPWLLPGHSGAGLDDGEPLHAALSLASFGLGLMGGRKTPKKGGIKDAAHKVRLLFGRKGKIQG